jgi:hypothetical protein
MSKPQILNPCGISKNRAVFKATGNNIKKTLMA